MATTDKAQSMNEAITKKVASILNNTTFVDDVDIRIKVARGEVTTIRYNIQEFITTEEDTTNEKMH